MSGIGSRVSAPGSLRSRTAPKVSAKRRSSPDRCHSRSLKRERQAIADTLQDTSGKLAETARRLGISRTTLWRRLKSYGMDGFRASP